LSETTSKLTRELSDEKGVDRLVVRCFPFEKPAEEGNTTSVSDTAPSACVQSEKVEPALENKDSE